MKKPSKTTETAAFKAMQAKWPPFPPEMRGKVNEWMKPLRTAQAELVPRRRMVDPSGRAADWLADSIAQILLGKLTDADLDYLGGLIAHDIKTLSADELEAEFAEIVRMKRNAVAAKDVKTKNDKPNRNAIVAMLWQDYSKKNGTGHGLKAFDNHVVEWTEKKMPGVFSFPSTPQGWTRIHKACGISHEAARPGKRQD